MGRQGRGLGDGVVELEGFHGLSASNIPFMDSVYSLDDGV